MIEATQRIAAVEPYVKAYSIGRYGRRRKLSYLGVFSADFNNRKNHAALKKDEDSFGVVSLNVTLAELIDANVNFVIFNSNIYRLWSRWIALRNISNFGIEHSLLERTAFKIITKKRKKGHTLKFNIS